MPAGSRDNPLEPIVGFDDAPAKPRRRAVALSAVGLVALVGLQWFLLRAWMAREDRPPSWDQSIHLEIAHDYAALLARGDLLGVLRLGPKPGMPPFPPLFELSLVHWLARPDAARSSLWANFGWLALLACAAWGLGLLYAGPWEGLAAAVLLACSPQAQLLARNHLPDLALAAWIAAAYLGCAWSVRFSRWPGSLLCGASLAGAMLTKWSAWTYLLPLGMLWPRAALGRPRRPSAWAALALATALCLPWYGAQLPVLLPRLVDASADQAVPFWRGWAALSYLRILMGGLDAPFWALALAAAVAGLQGRRGGGFALSVWFLSSLAFWTIVPNRQMRFLFPAVAPLAVLAPGAFPRLSALVCAWQLASAANFTYGWLPPLALTLGGPVTFFSSEPAAREDWKAAEILSSAQRGRDRGLPFSNLTLVANDARFNGPLFNWESARLGLAGIRVRGVNSRVCELSEFVVVKGGSLGPPSVVNQLPQVRREILEPGSWFLRGYERAGGWTLPDGSEAALYRRRRLPAPPWTPGLLRAPLLESPQYSARGVALQLGPWDRRLGAYAWAELSAQQLTLRGVEIHGLRARLEGVDFVPIEGTGGGLSDVRLLRLGRLSIESAEVRSEELAALLSRRWGRGSVAVGLDGTATVTATLAGGTRAQAEASLRVDGDGLQARLIRASLGPLGLPVPARVGTYRLSFAPSPELPFELRGAGLTLKAGRLSIP